jgi:hypothetical protein
MPKPLGVWMSVTGLLGFCRRESVVAKWARATSLRLPTLRDAMVTLRSKAYREVFPGTGGFVFLGDNLIAELRPSASPCPGQPIINLALILRANYFQGADSPQTKELPPLALEGVPLTFNADEFLRSLRDRHFQGISAATRSDRYTVWWGALEIEFRPPAECGLSEKASATAIRYSYQVAAARPSRTPALDWAAAWPDV